MNLYYAYTRVSTQKQGEKGVSLQEQRAAIERFAERQNLHIAEWFEERVTAAKWGRPIFTNMVKALRVGKAAGVVIHKIDRSARNLRDWSDLGELIDSGVSVLFANESIDLFTRGGRLSADIQAVVASDYVRNLREETIKGMRGRLKQGIWPVGAPIGYLDMGGGKLKEIDPVKGPLVRQAFELYGTGEYSLATLSEELFRRGLSTKQGTQIKVNSLSWILNNPFYMGLMRVKKTGESYPGKHTPLISVHLFRQVQARLSGKCQTRTRVHDFLLRGLFTCIHCKRLLKGEVQKGHHYYRCQTKRCPSKTFREECLEQAIFSSWPSVNLPPERKQKMLQMIAAVYKEEDAGHETEVSHLKAQLAATRQRLSRLIDAFVDGGLDKPTFETHKQSLLEEQLSLERRLVAKPADSDDVSRSLADLLELVCGTKQSYGVASAPQKRELINLLLSNRSVSGKEVLVEPYLPLAGELDGVVVQCCAHPRDTTRIESVTRQLLSWVRSEVESRRLDPADVRRLLSELRELEQTAVLLPDRTAE
jgi:DNA invertase Pin-like site-specific DNA recombinase